MVTDRPISINPFRMELYLATVKLSISKSSDITFKLLPSKYYTRPLNVNPQRTFHCSYNTAASYGPPADFNLLFSGVSTDSIQMPYNWYISANTDRYLISIDFFEDPQVKCIYTTLDITNNRIEVTIIPKTADQLVIDPLIQPLGSLLLVYLANSVSAFLIHASGVCDFKQGYIFTAVSGTGKSTMAKLWQQKGAQVINDDRLWIQKIEGDWYMFNTPMVWYTQKPAMKSIQKVFLLKQAPANKIRFIQGVSASMRVMSNCIQHFHQEKMTARHLEQVLDFTGKVAIYECAFTPDTSIVDAIRDLG